MRQTKLAINYESKKSHLQICLPITAFKKPENDKEYSKLEKILDKSIDEVRHNEKHPLAIAMQIIGDNLEEYDSSHSPEIVDDISNIELVERDLRRGFNAETAAATFLSASNPTR